MIYDVFDLRFRLPVTVPVEICVPGPRRCVSGEGWARWLVFKSLCLRPNIFNSPWISRRNLCFWPGKMPWKRFFQILEMFPQPWPVSLARQSWQDHSLGKITKIKVFDKMGKKIKSVDISNVGHFQNLPKWDAQVFLPSTVTRQSCQTVLTGSFPRQNRKSQSFWQKWKTKIKTLTFQLLATFKIYQDGMHKFSSLNRDQTVLPDSLDRIIF